MASIDVGGGGGKKKAVDSEIPLVPFIDLLLCCVMFLLVTAVWNQLARLNANQERPGKDAPEDAPLEEVDQDKLYLHIGKDTGYNLFSTQGDNVEIPMNKGEYDLEQLRNKLQARRKLDVNRTDIIVTSDDGVVYSQVVSAMDIVLGEGFKDMALDVKTALPILEATAQ